MPVWSIRGIYLFMSRIGLGDPKSRDIGRGLEVVREIPGMSFVRTVGGGQPQKKHDNEPRQSKH